MFKSLYLLMLMLPCFLYTSDGEIQIQDLEDIVVDKQSNQFDPQNLRPGSARHLAHAFAEVCYGKPCKPTKFLIEPCENLLKTLKKTDHQQYLHYARIIGTQTNKRTQPVRHRGITIDDPATSSAPAAKTGNVPAEFVQLALQAWQNDHAIKSGTIQANTSTISQQGASIDQLQKYGTYKTGGLAGTIAVIILQTVGYFIYTFVTHPC